MPEKLSQGPRIGYDSRVAAGLSRGPNTKKTMVAAAWSGTWPAPGATLDLDFANNRGFVRGLGQGGVMDGITFTRASVGKFVDQDGVVQDADNGVPRFDWAGTEVVAGNLIPNSEDFEVAAWSKTNVTVSKSGGVNTIQQVGGLTNVQTNVNQAMTFAVGDNTISVKLKPDGSRYVELFAGNLTGATNFRLRADLQDLIIGSGVGSIEAVEDGYFRVSFIVNVLDTDTAGLLQFGVIPSLSSLVWTTTSTDVRLLVKELQVEAGVVATPYKATGAQLPSTTPLRPAPTCNGLLIEEARTNRLLWCRDATQTQWVKTDITAAKDQTGIDGVAAAASSLTATADGGTCIQTITLASGSRTGSVYLKRLTGTGVVQVSLDGTTWSTVDLSTDEWRRIVLSGTVTNPVVGVRIAVSGDAVAMDFGQVEDGNYASSPVLTTAATSTRSADFTDLLGANFTPITNNAGQTIYLESYFGPQPSSSRRAVSMQREGNSVELVGIATGFGTVEFSVRDGSATTYSAGSLTAVAGAINKIAGSYCGSAVSFAGDSSTEVQARSTPNRGTPPNLARLRISGFFDNSTIFGQTVRRLVVVPRYLSESQLQSLVGK
jgi:hypothetical protein